MIAQHTKTWNQLLITQVDFDRLKHLVDSPRYRMTHAMLIPALKERLERCRVVEPGRVPRGVVTMHSKVSVRDGDTDEVETYTLVFPKDADINEGKLSVLAPLGAELLGARAGQAIEFAAPGGTRRLKIEKVRCQPESASDFHL